MSQAFIYDVVRTPRGIGKASGALYEVKPVDLLGVVLTALQERNNLKTHLVDDLIIGCTTPVADQGGNIGRAALLNSDWDNRVPSFQINRFCCSGLEAINLGASKIISNWERLVVSGGVESMSRVPIGWDGGPLQYDPAVANKAGFVPSGVGADLIATLKGYSRAQLDEYALLSHERAITAIKKYGNSSALVPVRDMNDLLILDKDESLHYETSLEQLAALSPSFESMGEKGYDNIALMSYPSIGKVNHVHTAGNSCGFVDAASLLLMGDASIGEEMGVKPRAAIKAVANACGDPALSMDGGVMATEKALKVAGLKPSDIGLWEMNETYASVVLKYQEDLGIPSDQLNVNGGAIALGHPVGATGSILIGDLLEEMERRDVKFGLVCIPASSGMATATIIEKV